MDPRNWHSGLFPGDPISAAQARTEAMLAMEHRWLFEERVAPQEQEETDDE